MRLASYWPRWTGQTIQQTNILITICYWFQLALYCIYVHRTEPAQRIIKLPSHINKLRGLDLSGPQWLVLNPSMCWGKTKPAAVTDTKCQRMMSLQKWSLFVLSISVVIKSSPLLKMTSKWICEILRHVTFASGHQAHSDSAQTSTGEMTERADVSERVQIEPLPNMTAASTTIRSSTCEQFILTWPSLHATLWRWQIIQVFHMTREERVCSNCSRAKITSSRSCGWVGKDWEMRKLLDLLNAPSSLECLTPPPVCPDFASFLAGTHTGM